MHKWIKQWTDILDFWGLEKEAEDLLGDSVYVYSAIPNWAEDSVRQSGLLSGKLIAKDKELLTKIHPDEKDREHWLKRMDDPSFAITYQGPNVFFTVPPKSLSEHPVNKNDMKILKINLSSLINDIPETKLHGLELIPYETDEEYESNKKDIGRPISFEEAVELSEGTEDEQWAEYTGGGFFAGNVPHAVVITPNGKIDSKYIEV